MSSIFLFDHERRRWVVEISIDELLRKTTETRFETIIYF